VLVRKSADIVDLSGSFCAKRIDRIWLGRELGHAEEETTPEQIVTLLRQIEVTTSQGKSVSIACREAGISDQSYYRWRKEYGGLDLDQVRRVKDLEKGKQLAEAIGCRPVA
jgi:Transposase